MNEIVTITGLKELETALLELDSKVNKRISVASMKEALKPTLAEVKREVPTDTSQLEKSLKLRVMKSKDRRTKRVGITTGVKQFQGDEFYGAFVEFGHRVGHRDLGNARTEVPGEHFLEHSWDETKDQVVTSLDAALWRRIEIEVGKMNKGKASSGG